MGRTQLDSIRERDFTMHIHVRVKSAHNDEYQLSHAVEIKIADFVNMLRSNEEWKIGEATHLEPNWIIYFQTFERIKTILRILGLPVKGGREDLLKTLESFALNDERPRKRQQKSRATVQAVHGFFLIQVIR